jgi:hypothetical protein
MTIYTLRHLVWYASAVLIVVAMGLAVWAWWQAVAVLAALVLGLAVTVSIPAVRRWADLDGTTIDDPRAFNQYLASEGIVRRVSEDRE